ncbi:DUF1176 domain-containing protein [Burkholderia pseudomultivorans]|uniref:DUF1176 domain-containing protein n=1 Tax=Burkholderia pseudomultivorans TaxID=1207504 RepID=A0ABU2E161_9BURK|nr:DUF1176 domain-containing protein [Burkholderia pseudomultivorans]MDR8730971.1 hypothetical protein [Burkholderia pseudomultivorans]MDR8734336.1 hypothetical protein [Burkholderia pseudomultivorans]MDR8742306.1 hypothetical protein [Burkholderia pseudomultivorans]MDR8753595.1 hypothetical protein [Burkholderia pseudomultivorans]MDR8775696.1 hypothetical protein [Burkholderia pseudomultivorans]
MFRRLSLAIAATLLAPSLAAHAHQSAQQSINRNFRNWSVVCDNTRRCIAESGGDDIDSRTGLIVRLTRDAGPDAPASLELFATAPLDLQAARVDGRPFDMMPARWQASDSNANTRLYPFHARTHDAATIDAWLAASRNAQTLSFGDPASASASASTPSLSLAGLNAALLLIDDAQGRIGTVTALLRKGGRPAVAVPAAPTLPAAPTPAPPAARLSAAEQRPLVDAVLAKFGGDVKRCAADMEDEMSPQDRRKTSQATSLSADDALVSIPCQTSSMYNHTDLWYRVRRSPPYAPTPVDFGENANAGLDSASFVNELTQASYDPADATLSSIVRLRSAGDCGSSASWIFDGRRFVLSDVAINGTCNGMFPDQWPRLYRTAGATDNRH